MRNVSLDSPFDPKNKPPAQHLQPDFILEKPTRLNVQSMERNHKPLAGRLTEIGQQILKIGSQKAKHICTGHWQEIGGIHGADDRSSRAS